MIGSLIFSAIVAVITILVGEFNEITSRVLITLFMVIFHSLASLSFIWVDEKQKTFEKLSPVDEFLKKIGSEKKEPLEELKVTKEELIDEESKVIVMKF